MRRGLSRRSRGCGWKVTRERLPRVGIWEVCFERRSMRPAMFAAIALGLLVACDEPSGKIDPVTVQWMEWPAEVNAGQPFRTRLVVWGVCALNPQFRAGASADRSAVTFAPYFLVDKAQVECLTERSLTLLALIAIDTAGTAPGLAAPSAHTYE